MVDQGLNPTFNLRPGSKGLIQVILLQVGGLFDLQRYVKAQSLYYVSSNIYKYVLEPERDCVQKVKVT